MIRIIGIICLAFFYCAAIEVSTTAQLNTKLIESFSSDQGIIYTEVSSFVSFQSPQIENITSSTGHSPVPSIKNNINPFGAIAFVNELFFNFTYSQYSYKSENFLIRFRKSDLIYPFHYFW